MAIFDQGKLDRAFRMLTRRNSVYVAILIAGGFAAEHVCNDVFDKLWISHNRGKLFEDIPNLGQRASE